MRQFYSLCALLGALTFCVPTVHAQTVTLIVTSTADDSKARDSNPGDGICSDNNGRCTLRAAIDEANASSGADVTVVIPGLLPGSNTGSYTLSRVAPNVAFNTYEDENAYGDLDIKGDFASLTLQGTGTPGPSLTISPNDRILDIQSGGTVILERIHITGGTARAGRNGNPDGSGDYGINGEDGADGGGVRVNDGMVVNMDQVTFSGNFTQSGGNGTAPASSIEAIDGGNGGGGGNGGALFIGLDAEVTITRGTFTQNGTGDGGSAASGQSNGEPADGGRGGNGGYGGAIYSNGRLNLFSCTIFANNAGDPSGGAAGVNGGDTGANGEGGSGGGIALARLVNDDFQTTGRTVLQNTIVAGNTAGDDTSDGRQPGPDFFDSRGGKSFTSRGFNFIGTKNASGAFKRKQGDQIGNGRNGINPQLNGLNQNADEAVPTLQPRAGSPVVDAGTTISDNDFDARGFLRPAGGQADKGAHERNSTDIITELSISDFQADGTDGEFITITNNGNYPAQADDHVLVAFPQDYNDAGASCLSINLYGEIQPGESFTVGGPAVDDKQHALSFDVRGPSCGDVAGDFLNDVAGAIGLYAGGATSIQGFVLGNYESSRKDLVEYKEESGSARSAATFSTTPFSADQTAMAFPNPTSGPVELRLNAPVAGAYTVQLMAPTGQVLLSRTLTAAVAGPLADRLELGRFPAGLYWLHVAGPEGQQTERLLVR